MRNDRFTNWRKSSRSSGATGNCVEVGSNTDERTVGIRDTKQHGRGPVLEFAPHAWKAFSASVTRGEIAR